MFNFGPSAPIRIRNVSPKIWAFLFSLVHILLAVVLFKVIYVKMQAYWANKMGGVWEPAWPAARTQFVLVMATATVWAAGMTIWELVIGCCLWIYQAFQSRYRGYKPFLNVEVRGGEAPPGLHSDEEEIDGLEQELHDLLPQEGKTSSVVADRWRLMLSCRTVRTSLYFAVAVFGLIAYTYEAPNDVRYRPRIEQAIRSPRPSGYGNGEKIFIAAMFHNNAEVLPFWTEQILKVVHYVGTDNVYISVLESYSGDSTPDDLLKFDKRLGEMGVARRVIVRDTTIPRPPSMETAEPRIRFLADSRNRALEPLVENGGFDRVIFSNDVLVAAESIVELLNTRGGDWDMVCGLDFLSWGLYDAWVIRDRLGQLVSSLWPYFLDEVGQEAVMADEPAPVFTCWNGIVALRADPLLPPALRKSGKLSTEPFNEKLPTTHPAYPRPANQTPATTPPLRFRVSAPKECFSSESFLLPYDLRRQFDMQNIYVNPLVITSYSWNYYYWFKYVTQHWLVRWWMKTQEKERDLKGSRMVVGQAQNIWTWDGGECQPWH